MDAFRANMADPQWAGSPYIVFFFTEPYHFMRLTTNRDKSRDMDWF